ncbi:HesB/YadR/YfhF family protein [Paenibacillus ginsengarvi]|uniref:Fe-S cluster assembly protein HesB n=1 Tax=Paenibacillus ginsengarvi TaxID=400777 RepID=A0A3B0CJ45_9BACL|nr:Fe-S cluster assembly protein HesB [Paenibacillus ginsengarvi]RKN84851.1 Fe-S cluster assembly protein HesB [Paenibacillus ginsengarvi]
MKLNVTDAAVFCFQKEWRFRPGDSIRIYVRYAGGGEDPYALGIMSGKPLDIGLSTVAGGITFFMEETDVWYLEERDLTLDAKGEDIYFHLTK